MNKDQKEPQGQLFAVYGTLRRGFGNYSRLLNNEFCEYLGVQKTTPEFTMISLGGFPGVIPGGTNTVVIEVFRVNSPKVVQQLNWLEGHRGKDDVNNFYNVMEINTNWGTANMYILDRKEYGHSVIESGDWSEHIKSHSSH